MREGWEQVTLSQLSKNKDAIVSGPFGSNLKTSDYRNEGVPILRLQNIGKGYFIDKDIKYITKAKAEELKYHSFVAGDIALAKLGIPIGKTCIIPESFSNGIIVADVVRIRPDKDIVDYKFLTYFLNTDLSVSQLTGNISGATRPRVNLSDVRDIELHLPPLSEQKRIVEILDEAFAAIDNAKANVEKNLQNAKELFESCLQEIFSNNKAGWTNAQLKDVFEIKPPKSEAKNKLRDNEFVSFLPMEDLDVLAHEVTAKQQRKLKEVVGSYTYFANNDVLLAKITPCFENGKLGIAKNLTNGIGFGSSEYIVFRSKDFVTPEYLYYFLSRQTFRNEGSKRMSGAVGHKRVIKEFVEEYLIPFPKNKNEQLDIVNSLNKLSNEIKRLEYNYQQKLNGLEELRKSILQKAFNGQLHLKDLVNEF